MSPEPEIIINGQRLSTGQAMTLRVALTTFLMDLQPGGNLEDMGEIGPLYRARGVEMLKLMSDRIREE